VGFEVDAGGAGDFGVGILDEGGADGVEEAGVFAEVPDAPFGAVDGVADFEEVGEGVGAVEGEGDHLAPALGFADGAAVLDEGEGDGVALAWRFRAWSRVHCQASGPLVVVEAQEEGDFLRALEAGEEIELAGPGGGFGVEGHADGAAKGTGDWKLCARNSR
jgi:hypothetical protein